MLTKTAILKLLERFPEEFTLSEFLKALVLLDKNGEGKKGSKNDQAQLKKLFGTVSWEGNLDELRS